MKKIIESVALFTYSKIKDNNLFLNNRVERELSLLNPGKRSEDLKRDYYVKKIAQLLLIISVGVMLVIATATKELQPQFVLDDNAIERKGFGQGSVKHELQLKSDEYDYGIVEVEVEEYYPSNDEINEIVKSFFAELEKTIIGNNESFDYVDNNLNLINSLDEYPFFVRWESSDYELIDDKGVIGRRIIDSRGEKATLKAIISYEDIVRIKEINLCIYPRVLTYEEEKESKLKSALENHGNRIDNDGVMYLPSVIDGENVVWTEKKEHMWVILLVILICVVMAIWQGADKDMHNKYNQRNQSLLEEYADIVSTLEMYLSAGLTIRGTIERMDSEYKRSKERGGKIVYAYEELSLSMKKMHEGYSEAKCYEEWGARCGLLCYRKLSSLLIQNLKKGTSGLIEALDAETKSAFEERKSVMRRKGEEAQTKLLFPMIVILGVVMIIIMIPAYFSFGI